MLLIFVLSIFVLALPACAPPFDREAMLSRTIDEVILPAHETFAAEADALDAAAAAFAADPTPAGLDEVQTAWLETAVAWKHVDIYTIGGTLLLRTPIEKHPVNTIFIETFITEEPVIDEAFIENTGSTSRGLPAIEYLIFDPEGDDARILAGFDDPQRRAYLAALAANLSTHAGLLLAHWSPAGGDYAGIFVAAASEGSDLQGSISMLANALISRTEMLVKESLGRPLGKSSYSDPHPEFAQAYLSGASLALAAANVEALQTTYRVGLEDYLVHLGGEETAAAIDARFDIVLADLAAIDGPLSEAVLAHPDQVERAYESLRTLVTLLKTDMANQLGITINFNDSDGD